LPSFPPSLALLSKKEGSGMAKRMKRKPSEDKAPSSAETAKILPSKEGVEALSPTPIEAEPVAALELTHPISLPLGLLNQTAMQLKALERYKGSIEDLYPRAYQQLCKEQKFLAGTEPRELEFIEAHGRCREPFEGTDWSKLATVPELKFDPANLEASCKMLRDLFEGISFPAKPATLEKYVRECHKAIYRERERRKTALRARGQEDVGGTAKQSYEAFAHDGLVFVGWQIEFLRDFVDYCSRGSAAKKAEELVLAKRRKKSLEKKSLPE
jgi:hypothetical protein